jgi:hypothetical protein
LGTKTAASLGFPAARIRLKKGWDVLVGTIFKGEKDLELAMVLK